MAQTTLDRVSARARELADRTGEATNQAIKSILPDRRPTRGVRRVIRGRATRRIRLPIAARASKATPTAIQTAWRTGEMAGRLEGIAATVPNMTRLWLNRSVAQMRLQTSASGGKSAVRAAPASIARLRLLALAGNRGKPATNARRTSQSLSDSIASVAKQAASIAAISGGVAALNKRLSTMGDRLNLPSGRSASNQARKTVRQTAKAARRTTVARRGWALTRGSTATGPLKGTQRRLVRSWRWVRLFTLGFALGAIWAYLFAPRRQTGQEQQSQQSTTTEQQRSAAQI